MFRRLAAGFRMKKAFIGAAACLLFGALSLPTHGQQIFRGEICVEPEARGAGPGKSQVGLQCASAHPKRGAHFVLSEANNKTVYLLDGYKKTKNFVGRYVVVVGQLDKGTGTILVTEILPALAPKVTEAKSVYIDCDACPRGMAAAWPAAFEELTAWGRYDVVPDPKKADLVFIFSANPYLGDYVTRDGPDKRPVFIEITYMDIVDPHTGQDLWGDSRDWGSLLVSRATRDLVLEFKQQLQIQESGGKN